MISQAGLSQGPQCVALGEGRRQTGKQVIMPWCGKHDRERKEMIKRSPNSAVSQGSVPKASTTFGMYALSEDEKQMLGNKQAYGPILQFPSPLSPLDL